MLYPSMWPRIQSICEYTTREKDCNRKPTQFITFGNHNKTWGTYRHKKGATVFGLLKQIFNHSLSLSGFYLKSRQPMVKWSTQSIIPFAWTEIIQIILVRNSNLRHKIDEWTLSPRPKQPRKTIIRTRNERKVNEYNSHQRATMLLWFNQRLNKCLQSLQISL